LDNQLNKIVFPPFALKLKALAKSGLNIKFVLQDKYVSFGRYILLAKISPTENFIDVVLESSYLKI